MLQPLAAVMPQSRHQSRGSWGLQSLCCSLCTTAHWQHVRMLQSLQECPSPVTNQGTIGACSPCVVRRSSASTAEVLCLHNGGLVSPPRRCCASTAEVLCLHNGGLVPPPRSLTAAASLQRCYAAATGRSNAPVPSPIKGLLGPAVLVLQPVHHSPLAACSRAAVTAGVPSPVTNQGTIGACSPSFAA